MNTNKKATEEDKKRKIIEQYYNEIEDFVLKGEELIDEEEQDKATIDEIENRLIELQSQEEEPSVKKVLQQMISDKDFLNIISNIFTPSNLEINYFIHFVFYLLRYNKAIEFLLDKKSKSLLKEYNKIIIPNDEGFYSLDIDSVTTLLQENGFIMSEDSKKDLIQDIWYIWTNQKEMLTKESLDDYSKEGNGLEFKKYLFCEQYLKSGRLIETCKSLGISRTTGYRYLQDKEVNKYIDERKKEIRKENDNLFEEGFRECFETLMKIQRDDDSSYNHIEVSDRVKAIDVYLRHYENITKQLKDNE